MAVDGTYTDRQLAALQALARLLACQGAVNGLLASQAGAVSFAVSELGRAYDASVVSLAHWEGVLVGVGGSSNATPDMVAAVMGHWSACVGAAMAGSDEAQQLRVARGWSATLAGATASKTVALQALQQWAEAVVSLTPASAALAELQTAGLNALLSFVQRSMGDSHAAADVLCDVVADLVAAVPAAHAQAGAVAARTAAVAIGVWESTHAIALAAKHGLGDAAEATRVHAEVTARWSALVRAGADATEEALRSCAAAALVAVLRGVTAKAERQTEAATLLQVAAVAAEAIGLVAVSQSSPAVRSDAAVAASVKLLLTHFALTPADNQKPVVDILLPTLSMLLTSATAAVRAAMLVRCGAILTLNLCFVVRVVLLPAQSIQSDAGKACLRIAQRAGAAFKARLATLPAERRQVRVPWSWRVIQQRGNNRLT